MWGARTIEMKWDLVSFEKGDGFVRHGEWGSGV
jgi:hypothetical protein